MYTFQVIFWSEIPTRNNRFFVESYTFEWSSGVVVFHVKYFAEFLFSVFFLSFESKKGLNEINT